VRNKIVLVGEGGEGAGKTTAVGKLVELLTKNGISAIRTREPGGCPDAESIRALIFQLMETAGAETMFGMFWAARAAHIRDTIVPALDAGKVGVAYSGDEVAAAKTIADFIKANKESTLSIVGGSLGSESLSVEAVKALAKLPSKDELRAKLVGTLQAPISGFVRTLSGNLTGLVRVLGAVRDSKGV
jgi:hypothetical protein